MVQEVTAKFEVVEELERGTYPATNTFSFSFDGTLIVIQKSNEFEDNKDWSNDEVGIANHLDRCSIWIDDLESALALFSSAGTDTDSLMDYFRSLSQIEWDLWLAKLAPISSRGELYSSTTSRGQLLASMTGAWENFENDSSNFLSFDGTEFEFETEHRIVNYVLDEYEFDRLSLPLNVFEDVMDQLQIPNARMLFCKIAVGWDWHVIEEFFSEKGSRPGEISLP